MELDDATDVYLTGYTLLTISATVLPAGEHQVMLPAIWPLRTVGLSVWEYRAAGRAVLRLVDPVLLRTEASATLSWWARLSCTLLGRVSQLGLGGARVGDGEALADIVWLLDHRPIPFDSLFLGFWYLMSAGTGAGTAADLTGLTLPVDPQAP